jgi:TubC N-terminal docking domain
MTVGGHVTKEAHDTMSASSFLADLWQRGVVLRRSDDGSRIVVPRNRLSRELRERLAHDKPEILKLLGHVDEYRALIRNAFAVMVHHSSARKGLRAFADDQARLTDELGPALTSIVRDGEARQWRQETGLCPVCGDEADCDTCREGHEAGADS